ncbi:Hsp20/alpha crystallin family protein [Bacillus sp. Bva_UNVM-123]|uniref:Hsp20/alpha crystallin family protein n=1 Tax=Bacillus sp. Bva_UNVM-123 TaxID=2829798 RepID=UPI00391EECB1
MFPWSRFPFNKDMKKMMEQIKPEEINHYIQNMMGQMLPEQMQKIMNNQNFNGKAEQFSPPPSAFPASVFETHENVYVRLEIKDEEWLKNMRLFHTSNQMIIEHIPKFEDKHTITLPALVKRKGTTAHVKDGILEIRIPKNIDMQYSEIDITET